MPSILPLAKAPSSAMRAFSDTRPVKVDRNIDVVPLGLEFRMAFGANVRFGKHVEIQHNGKDQNRNSNKIPRNVEVISKPIDLTRREHKS